MQAITEKRLQMAAKKTRLEVLRYLLANKNFDNQDDILKDLKAQGFKVAQPTLSRDLHNLKVSKVFDEEGHSIYALPREINPGEVSYRKSKVRLVQNFGFLKAMISGNLMVIKTLHGYASSLAAEIDNYNVPDVIGSLAGDDTVLLILKENGNVQTVKDFMTKIIPHFTIV